MSEHLNYGWNELWNVPATLWDRPGMSWAIRLPGMGPEHRVSHHYPAADLLGQGMRSLCGGRRQSSN